ncbi:MAG TPA: glycosyltransferase family 39 protein [Bryobacteraceae bacterium]|nr:glycosyltransferase family 39 protein [Bryobacteraceae bacterium]
MALASTPELTGAPISSIVENWFRRGLWVASAMAAVVILCYGATMLWASNELSPAESVVAAQSLMLVHDGTLYYDLKHYPYTVCAYMPAFYWLESGLIRLGLSAFHAGRWISLTALLSLILLSGKLVLLYTGDRHAAWVASLSTASSSLLASWGTVGQVDTLAAFFALAAFYQYSRFHLRGESTLWIAGVCAALALFTKQTMVAAPLAILVLLWTRDRKKALTFGAIFGAGMAALVLGINAALDGRFLANTVFANMNPFSGAKFLAQFRYFASISSGLLVILVASFSRMRRGRNLAPCIYLGFAGLMFLGTAAKIGSDTNYQIESTLLLAICTAIGLHQLDFFRLYFGQSKSWITLLLIPLALHMAIGYRVSANVLIARLANEKLFRAEIEQLRPLVPATGGLVLSTDFNAMVRLRQRMDVEPLIYNLLTSAGRIDPEPVRRDLARGAFSTVILSEDVFQKQRITGPEIGTLPASQLEEVRKHYRLVQHINGPFLDGIYVYQPASSETL